MVQLLSLESLAQDSFWQGPIGPCVQKNKTEAFKISDINIGICLHFQYFQCKYYSHYF